MPFKQGRRPCLVLERGEVRRFRGALLARGYLPHTGPRTRRTEETQAWVAPVGRGGIKLSERWEDGAHTLHGIFTNRFPNLLVCHFIQAAFGLNFHHYLLELTSHLTGIVATAIEDDIIELEATAAFPVLFGDEDLGEVAEALLLGGVEQVVRTDVGLEDRRPRGGERSFDDALATTPG